MAPSNLSVNGQPRLMTPPLTAVPECRGITSATNTTPSPANMDRVKRKAFHETVLLSQPPGPLRKRHRVGRSASQPPLRGKLAKLQNTAGMELDEDGMPIRRTPTTGRISKAKKGLPVHHCQYGCGKVYTRAEHRKRHEQNHSKDALFRCTVPDCQKEFQRFDLFQRHLEKQHGQGLALNDPNRAPSAESSLTSASTSDLQGVGGSMAMGLTTPPYTSSFPAYSMGAAHGQMEWQGTQHIQSALSSYGSETIPDIYTESLRHSSAQLGELHHDRSRTLSAPPTGTQGVYAGGAAQPSGAGGVGVWPQTSLWPQQPSNLGTAGAFQQPYGAVDQPGTDQLIASLDYTEQTPVAGSDLPAVSGGPNRPELVDTEHLQHYHDCYWADFDPLFPIVHRPSYSPASSESALLGFMMIAIGSQFSARAYSPVHSLKFYELACSVVDQIDPSDGLSSVPLGTLQGLFLWEYYSLYKRRVPGVHRSRPFVALYNHLIDGDPLGDQVETQQGEQSEWESWSRRETRDRLLAACFVLDTYRSHLFQQPGIRALPPNADIPRPCPGEQWKASDSVTWKSTIGHGGVSPSITPFKTTVEYSLGLHLQGQVDFSNLEAAPISAWALQLASRAPLRSLLVLANDNAQLFGQQMSPNEWTVANSRCQQWLLSAEASADVLSAGKILNAFFTAYQTFRQTGQLPAGLGFEAEWCLYIAAITFWAFTSMSSDGSSAIAHMRPALSRQQREKESVPLSPITQGSVTSPSQYQQQSIGAFQYASDQLPSPSFTASPRSVSSSLSGTSVFQPAPAIQSPPLGPRPFSVPGMHKGGGAGGAASISSAVNDPAVQQILQALDATDPTLLQPLRGRRGTAVPLMTVVRDMLLQDAGFKSLAVLEAAEVLDSLIEGEEIASLMGLGM